MLVRWIVLARLPVQLTPNVDDPVITVTTIWPGASPAEVEREIVQEQEEQLKGVEGVTKISAECQDSVGKITLEFVVGTDMSAALLKVNSRLQQVREYPEESDEPSRLRRKTIPQGTATTCYVGTSPDLAGVTGYYFADSAMAYPNEHMQDDAMAKRLWEVSLELTRDYRAA